MASAGEDAAAGSSAEPEDQLDADQLEGQGQGAAGSWQEEHSSDGAHAPAGPKEEEQQHLPPASAIKISKAASHEAGFDAHESPAEEQPSYVKQPPEQAQQLAASETDLHQHGGHHDQVDDNKYHQETEQVSILLL